MSTLTHINVALRNKAMWVPQNRTEWWYWVRLHGCTNLFEGTESDNEDPDEQSDAKGEETDQEDHNSQCSSSSEDEEEDGIEMITVTFDQLMLEQ